MEVGLTQEDHPAATGHQSSELGCNLYVEKLHVPFFVRGPKAARICRRIEKFATTAVLPLLLFDWSQTENFENILVCRASDSAISTGQNQARIQTQEWSMVQNLSPEGPCSPDSTRWLFAKPDDRLEVNEVSTICKDVADELELALNQHLQAQSNDDFATTKPESPTAGSHPTDPS